MHITARSYLTSGIAAIGAGAIALTPVQPLPDHMPATTQPAIQSLAVNLASSIDPITPWVNTFKTAAANFQLLSDYAAQQPLPLLTTWGKNQATYLKELFNGQAAAIPGQIWGNIQTLLQAPWWNQDGQTIPSEEFSNQYISDTQTVQKIGVLFNSEQDVYGVAAPLIASQYPDSPAISTLLQYTATHLSAQAAGLISPFLSGLVALTKSFTAVGQYVQTGDLIGAINELINIPANMTNAFLNGAGPVDLTAIVKNILPPAVAQIIQEFGVNLGGVLSPPVPYDGSLTNANKPPTVYTGGTLFDIVSAKATVAGVGAETTGIPVGLTAANISMNQFLANQLLVTPPPTAATAAAAVAAPAAAAATPAAEAPAAVEAPPAAEAPAAVEAPAPVEAPAAPVDVPAPIEIPAQPDAPAPSALDNPAPAIRGGSTAGGDHSGSDNAGQSSARGHRGAS